MKLHELPPDIREALRKERRDTRLATEALASACEQGSVENFYQAVDMIHDMTVDGWRLALKRVAKMQSVSPEIRQAFLTVWIEHKHLPLTIGDRRVTADALRILMPSGHRGEPLQLYRGTTARERQHRLYGFSWTTSREIARDKFAAQHRDYGVAAVVLATVAPREAVLLIREPEDYYDEGEVVVDPFRLGHVTVIDRLSP